MKLHVSHRTALFVGVVVLIAPFGSIWAGSAGSPVAGNWHLKMVSGNGRPMVSILSLSAGRDGTLQGQWISFWGVNDLTDVKYENGRLTFSRVARFRGVETKTDFSGGVIRGKLSGTLLRGSEETEVQGQRIRPVPQIAGSWDMKIKAGERDYTATLRISSDRSRQFSAQWIGRRGEHQITDVRFDNPNLTFRRTSKIEDRQWESTFAGRIKDHTLVGAFKSERGDVPAEGHRIGARLIGRWALQIESESGSRTQILTVYPDLTGLYGPVPIKGVHLEEDVVTFKATLQLGERSIEYDFKGQLAGTTLTGELTGSRGVRQVNGQKILSTPAKIKPSREKGSFREPDVIFVPTPHKVVDVMLELAQVKKDDVLYDLGCGDGRIVVAAAKKYGCRCVGYDISAQRVKESLENVRSSGVEDLVTIERADVFTLDLCEADVITRYLLPSLNVKLIPQLEELKPGSRIVSHDFGMEGVTPDKVVTIEDDADAYGDHTVYLWTVPLKKEAVIAD